jgi:hypothetical protein
MSPLRLLALYRLAFVALLTLASVQTLLAGHEGGHDTALLALLEIAAALALLWPRAQLAAAAVLLGVFAVAQLWSVRAGHWPTHLAQYAASTLLIVSLGRALKPRRAASG